jgi:hypothetical protein
VSRVTLCGSQAISGRMAYRRSWPHHWYSATAISRMEETLNWAAWLEPIDARVVWMVGHLRALALCAQRHRVAAEWLCCSEGSGAPGTHWWSHVCRGAAGVASDALKEELACGASIRTVLAWTGAGERTVKGWLAGANGPSGHHLEGLLRSSEAVYREVMLRTGRAPMASRQGLEALRGHVTAFVEALDATLGRQP